MGYRLDCWNAISSIVPWIIVGTVFIQGATQNFQEFVGNNMNTYFKS